MWSEHSALARNSGLQGQLRVSVKGSVQFARWTSELKMADAELFIEGDSITLSPAALIGGEGQGAQLAGEYNYTTRTLDATIKGQGLRLLSRGAVPLVSRFQGGKWAAGLRYHQEDARPGVWAGSFDVRDTSTHVPGVSLPVRIMTARLDINGQLLKVRQMRAMPSAPSRYTAAMLTTPRMLVPIISISRFRRQQLSK